jgi:aspartyl-tRNA(Asn)/glutamyl-tRNA(Gln) amidotransferase subunit A
VPATTAPSVTRLLDAGAVLVGKANLHEFAWGTTSQNPWYGTVRNPAHPGKSAGGSSGGSGAGLAADLCDLALGTDTGGSIRLPAACCEVVGLKPRWGGIPLDGVFPLCPTLDTVGPMARSVADVALAWSVMRGRPVPEPRLGGLTVGLLRQAPSVGDGNPPPRSDAVDAYTDRLQALGARVVEARVPEPGGDTWPLFFREAAAAHRATFPSRAEEYGENVRGKLTAAQATGAEAAEEARRVVETWRRLVPDVDLYVLPALAIDLPDEDADEIAFRLGMTANLRWVNLLGWAGLAIGPLQLVAPEDETVLAAGLAWERG